MEYGMEMTVVFEAADEHEAALFAAAITRDAIDRLEVIEVEAENPELIG